jgi:hypothetical protein
MLFLLALLVLLPLLSKEDESPPPPVVVVVVVDGGPRLTNFIEGSFIKLEVGSCSKRCEGKFIGFGAETTLPRDTIREPL